MNWHFWKGFLKRQINYLWFQRFINYRTETVEGGRLDDLTICGRVRGAWHLSGF
ncbi:TPA: hypothetical protein ACJ3ET_001277 [Neisseria meningitidis]|uniref:hypothetical protein n=1 Tax=Neisseria meningitidis TaxID=487 RepID=UPI000AB0F8A7|nr:hypothetical protein [Neisseria meningitidis]